MSARTVLQVAIIFMSGISATTAEAVCQNTGRDNYRRLLVSQPADIFFTAGVPSPHLICMLSHSCRLDRGVLSRMGSEICRRQHNDFHT